MEQQPASTPLSDQQKKRSWLSALFSWTGISEKKGWDWLQLLIIPLVLFFVTNTITTSQQKSADDIARRNRAQDLQIAKDTQEEATLKAYLDDMTTLILDKKLGSQNPADKAASDEAAVVARAKTLTGLRRLTDPLRKARVVQFLYEANLIGFYDSSNSFPSLPPTNSLYKKNILSLSGADLSDVDLHGQDLPGIVLRGAHLDRAKLSGAYLNGADLTSAALPGAVLSGADLSGAYLNGADLSGAHLDNVDLSGANLSCTSVSGGKKVCTDLSGANLSGAKLGCLDQVHQIDCANLSGAKVSREQLAQALLLKGAIMPDGSTNP